MNTQRLVLAETVGIGANTTTAAITEERLTKPGTAVRTVAYMKNHSRQVASKRHCPGCHFVQHRAERKQITARVQLAAAHLLCTPGTHVIIWRNYVGPMFSSSKRERGAVLARNCSAPPSIWCLHQGGRHVYQ